MARLPRLDLPGIPQHVVQRGNNRSVCFFDDQDRFAYLDSLTQASRKFGCQIHAYALMTNHVHLLATGVEKGAVPAMMQSVGRRYVRYINSIYGRTGTLFEGRYKSSLIESERYLLTCYRYIELNPVRARMVVDPGDYRWSSYRHHVLGEGNDLITDRPEFQSLGANPAERQAAYRAFVREGTNDEDLTAIRAHLNKDCALGSERFQQEIESMALRRAKIRGPGRPRRADQQSADI